MTTHSIETAKRTNFTPLPTSNVIQDAYYMALYEQKNQAIDTILNADIPQLINLCYHYCNVLINGKLTFGSFSEINRQLDVERTRFALKTAVHHLIENQDLLSLEQQYAVIFFNKITN